MFGNNSLPNNVPTHPFLSPPPFPTAATAVAPRHCPHGPSKGALIVDCDAYEFRHATAHHPRHVTAHRPSPRPPPHHSCPSPHRGMWADDFPHVTHCRLCHVSTNRPLSTATSPTANDTARATSPTANDAARATSLNKTACRRTVHHEG